ncbi:carbonic anhydrase 4-like [Sinocyclocheilus grahami]|uniref:carbonic anhydrase 4-like n=1 Tax=Sinocyclocheilus grahami TaxID=75366 RepID=UPI0007AC55AD|nr:PREDICTED: carbonic anhydrase 4-like [Sinocyclocheilus grahami]
MMNAPLICLAACLLHMVHSAPTSVSWCYHRPSCSAVAWPIIAEKYCNGTQQSPVDIVTANVQANTNLTAFTFTGYDDNTTLTEIKNTGTTIQVTLDPKKMHVEGGDLPGLFASMHFIEASNDTGRPESWKTLTSYLAKIASAGDKTHVSDKLTMDDLLFGVDRTKYYRYLGSLTTPNCDEGVIWTIFKDPIKVSRDLIDLFTTTVYINKTSNSPLMTNTFRGVQPINGRVVTSQRAGTKITGLIKPTSGTKTTGFVGTKPTGLIKSTSGIKTTRILKPTSTATNLSQAFVFPLSVILLYCILPL